MKEHFASSLFFSFIFLFTYCSGNKQSNHGLIGFGIGMRTPTCPFACQGVLTNSRLGCSYMTDPLNPASVYVTPLDCYANDDSYLETLALCINARCTDLPAWEIEKFWQTSAVGLMSPQPDPKESYQQALNRITLTPNQTIIPGNPLNQTSLIQDSDFQLQYNSLAVNSWVEVYHEHFGVVVFVTGVGIPVLVSLLRFAPVPTALSQAFCAKFIYPPLFGKRHNIPLPNSVGYMPTRGQALLIGYFIIINVLLSSIGYQTAQPNAFYPTKTMELSLYISNRVGVLSFANMALAILYATRNNVLLLMTNWTYGTFIFLHRWIGYIAILQGALHSALFLQIFGNQKLHLPQWKWGSAAVISMCLILPFSILYVRRRFYEIFLMSHIFFVVVILVGCWWHIYFHFNHQWGYETWLYMAFAFWGFDRLIRVLKLARNGIRRAIITKLDDDYVKVEIKGVAADGYAHIYFPTLSWRVWENHPFSVASTVITSTRSIFPDIEYLTESVASSEIDLGKYSRKISQMDSNSISHDIDLEKYPRVSKVSDMGWMSSASLASSEVDLIRPKNSKLTELPSISSTSLASEIDFITSRRKQHHAKDSSIGSQASMETVCAVSTYTTGLVFFIRCCSGLTKRLANETSLPVLIETFYGIEQPLYEYPTLVCIIGGVGITAVLSRMRSHPGQVKLYWNLKSLALAQEMEDRLIGIDKDVRLGARFDVREIVRHEVANGEGNLAIFVCGPAGMGDFVRSAVCEFGSERVNGTVKLIEEAFLW